MFTHMFALFRWWWLVAMPFIDEFSAQWDEDCVSAFNLVCKNIPSEEFHKCKRVLKLEAEKRRKQKDDEWVNQWVDRIFRNIEEFDTLKDPNFHIQNAQQFVCSGNQFRVYRNGTEPAQLIAGQSVVGSEINTKMKLCDEVSAACEKGDITEISQYIGGCVCQEKQFDLYMRMTVGLFIMMIRDKMMTNAGGKKQWRQLVSTLDENKIVGKTLLFRYVIWYKYSIWYPELWKCKGTGDNAVPWNILTNQKNLDRVFER
jgi:hypothetical protein